MLFEYTTSHPMLGRYIITFMPVTAPVNRTFQQTCNDITSIRHNYFAASATKPNHDTLTGHLRPTKSEHLEGIKHRVSIVAAT